MKKIDLKTLAICILSTFLFMTIGFVVYIQLELNYFKSKSDNAIIKENIYEAKIEILDDLIKDAEFQKSHYFNPLLEHNYDRQRELDSLTLVYKWNTLEESLGGEK